MGCMKRVLIAIAPTLSWTCVFIGLAIAAFVFEQIVDRVHRWIAFSKKGPKK